jgi:hypothetical protein
LCFKVFADGLSEEFLDFSKLFAEANMVIFAFLPSQKQLQHPKTAGSSRQPPHTTPLSPQPPEHDFQLSTLPSMEI